MEHFPLRQNMILTTSFFLLATVQLRTRNFRRQIYVNSKNVNMEATLYCHYDLRLRLFDI
jgi:hypothetical protein